MENKLLNQEYIPPKRFIPEMAKTERTPEDIVCTIMKNNAKQLASGISNANNEYIRRVKLLATLALEVFIKIKAKKTREVLTLCNILKSENVEIIAYDGTLVTDEFLENVNVVDWLPAKEDKPEHVCETYEPEIRIDGQKVYTAKVICRKAPDEPVETLSESNLPANGEASTENNQNVSPVKEEISAEKSTIETDLLSYALLKSNVSSVKKVTNNAKKNNSHHTGNHSKGKGKKHR